MKSGDFMRLAVFGILFGLCLTILFTVQNVAQSLTSIQKRVQVLERPSEFRMQPQYSMVIPPTEKGKNPYYEGFFRDYGDGEIHPHRQALMLLLSHLASQGERPPPEMLPETLKIEVKKPK
tara:strand:+ start:162 stop:524 length:363 start_codon:yes stop_codon:yes gene_type:complete